MKATVVIETTGSATVQPVQPLCKATELTGEMPSWQLVKLASYIQVHHTKEISVH